MQTRKSKVVGNVKIFWIDADGLRRSLYDIASKIKSEHPEVSDVILFGSFSTETYTPESDLDVAIIVSNTEGRFVDRPGIFIDYFSKIDLDVNLMVYTIEEFQSMQKVGNRFIEEIQRGQRL